MSWTDDGKPRKRFLIFAGELYYPSGGAADLVHMVDTKEECLAYGAAVPESDLRWWNALDLQTGEVLGRK